MKKTLQRSKERMFAGVCAGVANYFNTDATLVRIIWTILALCGSLGIWIYLICWLVMPEEA
ncbi:MAG: PspC domain-containing protein [Paludibacter sp.]|nr:PspC domain-containing protein [Bacteroidales bacterium]MCM1069415.1 PspC domain-containing protein [Prevotella sp.]MCM1353790.1 PspC domain-containing protein [Bacteroides sp.]MCM1442809.1 PspC domain-containing protein [Muribaculum sp.]MCM1481825.1 PspC domain-containing protein [Paludibacter sp.]